jgi:hypothetical protein
VECHVDAGGDAGGGDDVAVVDVALARLHGDGGVDLAQLVQGVVVAGCWPAM